MLPDYLVDTNCNTRILELVVVCYNYPGTYHW